MQRQHRNRRQHQRRQQKQRLRLNVDGVLENHGRNERRQLQDRRRRQVPEHPPAHGAQNQDAEGVEDDENGADQAQMSFRIGQDGTGDGVGGGARVGDPQHQGPKPIDRRSRMIDVARRRQVDDVERIEKVEIIRVQVEPQPRRPALGTDPKRRRNVTERQRQQGPTGGQARSRTDFLPLLHQYLSEIPGCGCGPASSYKAL